MKHSSPGPSETVVQLARVALRSFLESGAVLDCAPRRRPQVSILLLLYNRAELTFLCLQSLALGLNRTPVEIVAVDNGSTDETGSLLRQVHGIRTVRNGLNVGFPRGVNQAARQAAGKYLLLLNNDTQVLGRSLDAAAGFLDAHPGVGAVGGKLILFNGNLQEAGCTVCRDGWVVQYGRQQSPDAPAYNFQRDVDYCSAAFLMTPRELFFELGGLDETFSPGYFEDTDYCLKLRQAGRRVVYLPGVAILHHELATSVTVKGIAELCQRHHDLFAARHAAWLEARPAAGWPELLLRSDEELRFNVLVLADGLVGDRSAAEALPRLGALAARVEELGGSVTVVTTGAAAQRLRHLAGCLPRTVEFFAVGRPDQAAEVLAARLAGYDLVLAGDDPAPVLPAREGGHPPVALWRDGGFVLADGAPAVAGPAGRTRGAA